MTTGFFVLFMFLATVSCQNFDNQFQHLQPQDPQPVDAQPVEPEVILPYRFAWSASRHYNAAPDREHEEERSADGITRGVFRYIDPRKQVQEVRYVADDTGFYVDASNLPQDTRAVAAAKQRHQTLFDKIAAEHAALAAEAEAQKQAQAQAAH